MKKTARKLWIAIIGGALAAAIVPAAAQETLKIAVPQRGNWDTSIPDVGERAGINAKHNIKVEALYTAGSGETLQAVLSGSVDIGLAFGTQSVFGDFAKGAPVRIISAQSTGAADYWYVRADSKLTKLADATADTTIAYSSTGSSTNAAVLGFLDLYHLKSKPVATGSPPATMVQVMSGQVDVGWASPPFGLDALRENKIRIVGRAIDIPRIHDETIRVNVATVSILASKKDAIDRFLAAYRETIDALYVDPKVLKIYADYVGVSEETAKYVRDNFFPKTLVQADEIKGIPLLMEDAIQFKYLRQPLTAEQLKELIQIPPPK